MLMDQETAMISRKRGFRAMVYGLLIATGVALTPAAFARTHVDVGIGVPGGYIGYHDGYRHHGGYGYVGGGYYAPSYYAPYYRPTYYAPAYYGDYYGSCVVRGHYDRWGRWHPGHRVPC